MDIKKQIERGVLVCPRTKQKLRFNKEHTAIVTEDGKVQYGLFNNNVPILIADNSIIQKELFATTMNSEYEAIEKEIKKPNLFSKCKNTIRKFILNDFRSQSSQEAMKKLFKNCCESSVSIAIGGGPKRHHPLLTNLNMNAFVNVDIVADAHVLPYADESVDVIYCEAVLEHLYDPASAVAEMFRCIKKGGKLFVCTPFMQPYHGYPHHYQNFTLTGQRYLFERHNFNILESGTCVGPTYAIVFLVSFYIKKYLNFFRNPFLNPIYILWVIIGFIFLKPLDFFLNKKENAHLIASTTYLLATKK